MCAIVSGVQRFIGCAGVSSHAYLRRDGIPNGLMLMSEQPACNSYGENV